jgi:subtilase family serine protease
MDLRRGRALGWTALICLLMIPIGTVTASAAAPTRSADAAVGVGATPASCNRAEPPGVARCYLSVEPGGKSAVAAPFESTAKLCTQDKATGWTACNLENAYAIKSLIGSAGNGSEVAVVDPYDDPNAATDLATYRSFNKLPACTTTNGCFEKVNQEGQTSNYPSTNSGSGWADEISLDMDMVSAICPLCHILLVEANSNGFGDLTTAEDEAAALSAGIISNSWGTGEFNGENGYDASFDHPGVDITDSSGDGAYQGGVQYPSASPYVTSVGGHPAEGGDEHAGLEGDGLGEQVE